MRFFQVLISTLIISVSVFASTDIISPYKGSEKIYDDNIGFETMYYLAEEQSAKSIDGDINRRFYKAPQKVSPYEIVKNYEQAIKSKGGQVIHLSKNAYRHFDKKTGERVWFMRKLFNHAYVAHQTWAYLQLFNEANHYVVGKVSSGGSDIYINVASASVDGTTYYEVVTAVAKPMDMNNVTLNVLNEGIAANGKVAVYDIYFDSGKYEIKHESASALKTIAAYLKENPDKMFIVVGHTDSDGSFNANIKLSEQRADAVVKELVSKHAVDPKQVSSYGVGSVSPVTSNSTEDGKARNRRVELVQR
jgi:outer membrane protein OmpA-like peptidoglycan-associated protein